MAPALPPGARLSHDVSVREGISTAILRVLIGIVTLGLCAARSHFPKSPSTRLAGAAQPPACRFSPIRGSVPAFSRRRFWAWRA